MATVTRTKRLKAKAKKWQKFRGKQPPEWGMWRGMKKRCHYEGNPSYPWYGGKGISVCDRWREAGTGFKNFREDMGSRPSPLHDLDRIDVDKDYCKENCRWLDRAINRGRVGNAEVIVCDTEEDPVDEMDVFDMIETGVE